MDNLKNLVILSNLDNIKKPKHKTRIIKEPEEILNKEIKEIKPRKIKDKVNIQHLNPNIKFIEFYSN
jgi:hypothetical protein